MKIKNVLWGLFFLLIGAVIIVDKLGYIEIGNMFSFVITVLLIPVFVKSIARINFGGILLPPAIVCILYSSELGLEAITPWPVLLCAVFASIGLTLIFGHHHSHFCHKKDTIILNGDECDIDIDVNFNSVIKYVDSDNLKGGKIDCSFGAATVYFDKAKLNKDGATIKLDVSFAGVELYVPKEWKVNNKVNVFAGAVEEKNHATRDSEQVLTLVGEVHFSGVEIIYV